MTYIIGESRDQFTLTPLCLDDYIGPDSICRVIEAYVSRLDMIALGFKYAEIKDTGRPPFDPAKMLSLYIYGYLNRVRSSRRLEAETGRNIEVMWLMDKLTPDDKTISNFRKDNAAALRKVFREFSLWCSAEGLYGKELIAVDGTKIRAASSRKNSHTQKFTEKQLADVEKKITKYMKSLDENDAQESDEVKPSAEAVQDALKKLTDKKAKLEGFLDQMKENGVEEISTVDPDCRIMKQGGDGRPLDACYNVQTAVDAKNKLIVDFEVTSCAKDAGSLFETTQSAKEILDVQEITVVADKGYYEGKDIADCENHGTTCLIPEVPGSYSAPDPKYDHENFIYNKESDIYTCPEGQALSYKRVIKHNKADGTKGTNRVYGNPKACANCPHRAECTESKNGRSIYRSEYQDTLDEVDARMSTPEGRQTFKKRQQTVEHPFGTTKHGWGYRNYLCRGKEKTTAEQSMVFLAYNLRRVINIFKANEWNLVERLA